MKTFNIVFEDDEYTRLAIKKGESKLNWHDFIMLLAVRKLPKRIKNGN